MTRFVVTAGFNPQKILQPLVGYGVSDDDSIWILAPAEETPPDRREQAIDDATEMLEMVGGDNITIQVSEIDCSNFISAIFDCQQVLQTGNDDNPPVVCLGGGVTDLLIPLVLATTLMWPQNIQALRYYSELHSTGRDCRFPNLLTNLPGRAAGTYDAVVRETGYRGVSDTTGTSDWQALVRLPVLGDGINESPPSDLQTTTIDVVADITEQSSATVSRHASALADADLLTIYRGGERNRLCPTITGLLRVPV